MLSKMGATDFNKLSQFIVNYYFDKSEAASTQKVIH